jgi:hypothetical protein
VVGFFPAGTERRLDVLDPGVESGSITELFRALLV